MGSPVDKIKLQMIHARRVEGDTVVVTSKSFLDKDVTKVVKKTEKKKKDAVSEVLQPPTTTGTPCSKCPRCAGKLTQIKLADNKQHGYCNKCRFVDPEVRK